MALGVIYLFRQASALLSHLDDYYAADMLCRQLMPFFRQRICHRAARRVYAVKHCQA